MKRQSKGDNRIHKSLLLSKPVQNVSPSRDKTNEDNPNQINNNHLNTETIPLKTHRSTSHDIQKQNFVSFK
jgi:hypothetical protein